MRAIWSGSISFGLVNIPVKLFSAIERETLNFDMLHKEDLSPIRYARICKKENKEISYEQIVKGYLLDGSYIPIYAEDFEKANRRKVNSIEIFYFSEERNIDPIYFEQPYYLGAVSNSLKSYNLLLEALKQTKKAAIAKFVLRNREHLALIRPYDKILLLHELRFSAEIRPTETIQPEGKTEYNKDEVNLALALIDHLTRDFEPEDFKDTYKQELIDIIKQKAEGKIPSPRGEIPQTTEVVDLMSVLKKSLEREKVKKQ